MITKTNLIRQILFTLILALGAAGVIISGLGIADIDIFTYFLMKIMYPYTKFGVGTWGIIINVVIALVLYLLTKNKRLSFSVLIIFVLGMFVNMWLFMYEQIFDIKLSLGMSLHSIGKTNLAIVIAIPSLILIALGVALTASFKGILTPYDELALYLEKKMGKYFIAKITLDFSFMVLGILLGLIDGNPFEQIGFFSIVIIVVIGPMINFFLKMFRKEEKSV